MNQLKDPLFKNDFINFLKREASSYFNLKSLIKLISFVILSSIAIFLVLRMDLAATKVEKGLFIISLFSFFLSQLALIFYILASFIYRSLKYINLYNSNLDIFYSNMYIEAISKPEYIKSYLLINPRCPFKIVLRFMWDHYYYGNSFDFSEYDLSYYDFYRKENIKATIQHCYNEASEDQYSMKTNIFNAEIFRQLLYSTKPNTKELCQLELSFPFFKTLIQEHPQYKKSASMILDQLLDQEQTVKDAK